MNIKRVGKNTVVISFLAFIGLGMSGGLLGLAWPSMQKQFGLPLDGVTPYFVLSTVAYTLSSFSIGRLMARFGSGTVLLVGSTLVALSLSGMAAANSWGIIVVLAFVSGLGRGMSALLTQSRGIDPGVAGVLVSVYWGVFTGGRIVFGFIANRFEINRLLRACMLAMIVGAVLLRWNPVDAIGLLGLFII